MLKILKRNAGLPAGIFFLCTAAWATTFGPIPVYQQAQNTQYYVHGRVTSGPSTMMEQHLQRPYTYWTVQIAEQLQGEPLGAQISIREPGGEIGELGYHVASTAEFIVGEDVFVALHDTEDGPGVKEVVGLASGKYRVEASKDGKQVVMNGLGLPVTGEDGQPLGPEDFSALLKRIAQGEATAADKNVWVTRNVSHGGEDPGLEGRARKVLGIPERGLAGPSTDSATSTASGGIQQTPNPAALKENSVQESPPKADEASTGFSSWGWLIGLAVLVGIAIGIFLALKKR